MFIKWHKNKYNNIFCRVSVFLVSIVKSLKRVDLRLRGSLADRYCEVDVETSKSVWFSMSIFFREKLFYPLRSMWFNPTDQISKRENTKKKKIVFWCHFDRREKLLSSNKRTTSGTCHPQKQKVGEESRLLSLDFFFLLSSLFPILWLSLKWINDCVQSNLFLLLRLLFMGQNLPLSLIIIHRFPIPLALHDPTKRFPYVHFPRFSTLFSARS